MITRRQLVAGTAAVVVASGAGVAFFSQRKSVTDPSSEPSTDATPESVPLAHRPQELRYLSKFVHKNSKWEPGHLFEFVNGLSNEHLDPFGKSLEIDEFSPLKKSQKVEAVHKELLWQSSSIFTYPFKSLDEINYHEIVVWCATQTGLPKNEARFTSTWDLERYLLENQFENIWDKLAPEKRLALLQKIDSRNRIESQVQVAALSFKEAQTVLMATTYFGGFSLYSTMSTVIATVAGWFGVTLPFGVYTTVASTMAILSGPIGWAIGAVVLAGSFAAWAGKANLRKTVATVMQIHSMKAAALYAVGDDA